MLPLPSEIKENKITSFETYMENFEFLKYLSALMTHNKSKANDKRIHEGRSYVSLASKLATPTK